MWPREEKEKKKKHGFLLRFLSFSFSQFVIVFVVADDDSGGIQIRCREHTHSETGKKTVCVRCVPYFVLVVQEIFIMFKVDKRNRTK